VGRKYPCRERPRSPTLPPRLPWRWKVTACVEFALVGAQNLARTLHEGAYCERRSGRPGGVAGAPQERGQPHHPASTRATQLRSWALQPTSRAQPPSARSRGSDRAAVLTITAPVLAPERAGLRRASVGVRGPRRRMAGGAAPCPRDGWSPTMTATSALSLRSPMNNPGLEAG
jgi:hypothetical protein